MTTKNTSIFDKPHTNIKVYHLAVRDADNDTVNKWFTDKKKAEKALAAEIRGNSALALMEGGYTTSSAIYLSNGPAIEDEEIGPYNEEMGTNYDSWRDAAIANGGFIAEWTCCSAEASLTEHDAIKLKTGKVYIVKEVKISK